MLTTVDVFVTKQKQLLKEAYETKSSNLAGGCAHDYAAYRYHTGFIQGLKFVLDSLEGLAQEAKDLATGK